MSAALPRTKLSRALEPFRAREWWEHKLGPMLGTGYMTASHLRSSLLNVWPTFAATLVGVAAAAAYVSLINDVTDRKPDAAAGKYNRLAARPGWYAATAIGGVLTLGVGVAAIAWRDDPLALALYAGPWLAFSLYSLPPVRLKTRGAAGALADASGAHLFPQLLVAVVTFHAAGRPLEAAWLAAVAAWALAAGIRGALWHQLGDVEADRRSGVRTFALRHPARAEFVGRAAFAIEMAGFAFLLWRAGTLLPFAILVPYGLLELARLRLWGVRLIVVSQAPSSRIAMHEYYVCLYPLAFLVAATFRHPRDAAVLVVHLAAMTRDVARGIAHDAGSALTRLAADLRTVARFRRPGSRARDPGGR